MVSKLDHALTLAARGFKVFPIKAGAKSPPLLNGWPERASADPATVRDYWLAVPDANIGIHCEGLLVIDVDVKKGGHEAYQKLCIVEGLLETLTARTPTGGCHYYFRLPDDNTVVSNSVGKLGSGLDIRSKGGYVVAPGSTLADGSVYAWVAEQAEIMPVPDWLLQRCGSASDKQAPGNVPLADAGTGVVDRAANWLRNQPAAIEGQGGDAHTFKVACGLRDLGVSEAQAVELLAGEWNGRCSPPWMPNELGVKVRNAYNYGQNEPGAKAVLPEDFPVVQESVMFTNHVHKQNTNNALRLSAFAESKQAGAGYLIKGLLQRATYAELFGAPGEGKTFVALDMAYHVAAGMPWMDRKVRAGTVLYLAYEGIGGLVKRAQALRKRYGGADVPLFVAGAAYSLRERAGRQELAAILATLPEKPALIVIDTFARALMGGDENSAQDVGAFNSAVAALIESTGACVMLIHHSGKNKSAGARGSSALMGAIDTELEVDNYQVTASKQRDVETGEPIGFKLVPVVVGLDEDGDELTSCVVDKTAAIGRRRRLTGNALRGFEVLCDLSPSNTPVSEIKWREACHRFLPARKATWSDIVRKLTVEGYIVIADNGTVTRRMT